MKGHYKLTGIGAIPQDWEVRPLGEIAAIATGNTPPTSDASNYGDEYLFVSPVDMGDWKYISRTQKRLSTKGFAQSRRFPQGSVLFVCIGSTIGKCGIAPVDLTSNQQINALFPSSAVTTDYLYYAACGVARSVRASAGEQAVPIVNKSQFAQTLIAVPPVTEQRAIATVLSDADALLLILDQLIAKKRDLKQAAMQALLTGRRRLPGFAGGWSPKRLGDVGKCLRGVSYKGDADLYPYDMPRTRRLLRSNNVQDATVVARDLQFVDSERVSPQQVMQMNDILICMANGSKELVGKAGAFAIEDGYPYTFGAFMGCFRTSADRADPNFVFFLFQTGRYREYINNLLSGSSINNLRPSAIESLEFSFPSLAEQAAVAAIICDMDAEIASLEARRDKTRAIKQGMMQELLTGRIRLV